MLTLSVSFAANGQDISEFDPPFEEQPLDEVTLPTILNPLAETLLIDEVNAFLGFIDLSPNEKRQYKANATDESSQHLGIPEPLVVDLVRPLGARKGEAEVNTLLKYSLSRRRLRLNWAPEVEMAVADNHAIEFELPFANEHLDSLKTAYQITLQPHLHNHYVHGVQVITEYLIDEKAASVQPLYIAGYAFNPKLSVLNLVGPRLTLGQGQEEVALTLHPSVFYNLSQRLTVGLETNWDVDLRRGQTALWLMPQAHLEVGRHMSLQVGAGVARHPQSSFRPVLALRLIAQVR
jgi:hypothetical protein